MAARWVAYAEHILDCIEKIAAIEERGRLTEDEVLYAATLRHLQTLSEATQRLPDEVKNKEPLIPWAEISGFRNILVHNYLGNIDAETIQTIVSRDLPDLKAAIQGILEG